MWQRWKAWRQEQRLLRQLAALDDRLLRDMGFDRDQLAAQVRQMLVEDRLCPCTADGWPRAMRTGAG